MAIVTNGNNTIKVNDYIYPKDDINIYKNGTKVGFKNNFQTLEIEYAEISSPTSTDINNLIEILLGYLSEGNVNTVSINSTSGSGGSLEDSLKSGNYNLENVLDSILFELKEIRYNLEELNR